MPDAVVTFNELSVSGGVDAWIVQLGVGLAILLAAVELAKRIAEITPSKRDDQIVSIVESVVRKAIDMVAGRGLGRPNDPGMIDPSAKPRTKRGSDEDDAG